MGGQQSNDNLIPATAAANYNILQIIENPVAELLEQGSTNAVHFVVTVVYADDSEKIPVNLVYELSYTIDGKVVEECHHINPRSNERYGPMVCAAIRAGRKASSSVESLYPSENENDENLVPPNSPKP